MNDVARIFARVLGAALPLSILALGVPPTAAQYKPPTISASYEVAVALQRLGMRPIATPRQRGLFWIAPAMDRDGTRVRVVIEAGTGAIVDVDEIEAMPLRPRAPLATALGPVMRYSGRGRWSNADDDEEVPAGPRVIPADPTPRPRASVPAPRIVARPSDQKPRTTPLPRPRPSEITAAVPQPAPAATAPAAKPDAWGPPVQGFE